MKNQRLKQILDAATKLPPEKGRALVAAIAGKGAPEKSVDDYLAEAEGAMIAAMEKAMLAELENLIEPTP